MVQYASGKGIYTATSTNAHYLNDVNAKKTVESGLDRLIISIDGTTQDTYQSYRIGGHLDKVIEGAKNVIRWKKELKSSTPHVIFQFLVVKPNEHQIDELQSLAKKIGVDEVGLKTAQVYDYEHGNPLIPTIGKYSRYKQQADGTYTLKNLLLNHCWKLWHSCVITWDGLVVPCCFDKDAEYRMGDLKKDSFKTLWMGDTYKQFRAAVLRSRGEIDMCRNCTEGTKVWA
jgi:radical SAM protein with 4Fe4S-binding SPASM domain